MISPTKVKQLRRRLHLTQRELAERMGVATSRIGEIESGINKNPKMSTIESLAKALEVPIGELLENYTSPITTSLIQNPVCYGSTAETYTFG